MPFLHKQVVKRFTAQFKCHQPIKILHTNKLHSPKLIIMGGDNTEQACNLTTLWSTRSLQMSQTNEIILVNSEINFRVVKYL
jgi:hypothetical protein